MEGTNEVSIDYYVNHKNKIQEQLNQLDQSQLIELFTIKLILYHFLHKFYSFFG